MGTSRRRSTLRCKAKVVLERAWYPPSCRGICRQSKSGRQLLDSRTLSSALRSSFRRRRSFGIDTLQVSRFRGKEIRECSRVHAGNPTLRKGRNGFPAVTFIPFDPGASVEYPRRGVIQCRLEIGIAEVLSEDFNILIRSVRHRIGEKARWEFQCFFWSSKPEDSFCNSQKFVSVNHRSLPCGAKSRFPTSTGS